MVAGKVSSLATDVTGAKVTEQLGYTDTDVFNDATANTALRNFVQGITGLTTNTYVSATVTYEVDLDTNNPPAAKTTPTLAIDGGNTIPADGRETAKDLTYNGDGELYVSSSNLSNVYFGIVTNTGTKKLVCTKDQALIGGSTTGTLYASEGTNYKAASVNFTFTY